MTTTPININPHNESERKTRILCLHGHSQTGEIFRTRLEKAFPRDFFDPVRNPNVECDFPDGPVALPLREGDAVPRRGWWTWRDGDLRKVDLGTLSATVEFMRQMWEKKTYDVVVGFSQGATLAVALAFLFPNRIKLVMAAAGHDFKTNKEPGEEFIFPLPKEYAKDFATNAHMRAILLYGEKDTVVAVPDLATCPLKVRLLRSFPGMRDSNVDVILHPANHIFPNLPKSVVGELMALIGTSRVGKSVLLPPTIASIKTSPEDISAQRAELEVLRSIYGEAAVREDEELGKNSRFTLTLAAENGGEMTSCYEIEFRAGDGYPSHGRLEFTVRNPETNRLVKLPVDEFPYAEGEIQAFQIAAFVQERLTTMESCESTKLNQRDVTIAGGEDDEELEEGAEHVLSLTLEDESAMGSALEDAAEDFRSLPTRETFDDRAGVWRPFVVGLIGKPSAGKSSFFNVVTAGYHAKTGAQPFTTIDPNIRYVRSDFAYKGRTSLAEGILVKDVAGLVPNAWKGRGKGNRFLNDLLDADVLIHIIDGSGSADREGRLDGGGEGEKSEEQTTARLARPAADCKWILRELHLWIYFNVAAKWPRKGVKSREQKKTPDDVVCSLFSGYHAAHHTTRHAARLAGLELIPETVARFTSAEIHRLVAYFIFLRFPIIYALNKIDLLRETREVETVVAEVARATRCDAALCICPMSCLSSSDTSGLRALTMALDRKAPLVTVALFRALNVNGDERDWDDARSPEEEAGEGVCLLMRHHSKVYDVYLQLSRQDVLRGDFVRAEYFGKAVSRDKLLSDIRYGTPGSTPGNERHALAPLVFSVFTNKKVNWQATTSSASRLARDDVEEIVR